MSDQKEVRFGIDRLVTNGRRIFGWGWVAHPTKSIATAALKLEGDGWQSRLPADFGLTREDVERAFPSLRNAGSSGFVVTGYPKQQPVKKATLDVRFDDGESTELDITHVIEARPASRRKLREVLWLARAAGRRLVRGDFRGIARRALAQNYGAPSLDDVVTVTRLLPQLATATASVVFDHNLGGGANQYRRQLIGDRLAAGSIVLLCTYNLPTLDYRLQVFRPGGSEDIYRMSSFVGLDTILAKVKVTEIFVNSPVSFDEPLVFADWIASMRASLRATRLTVAVHDYFVACPSFVLLDADGKYCGIPEDLRVCAQCLPRHPARYVALSPPTEIGPWRSLWGRCLASADEIRCFSQSTRRLLLRAYPTLDEDRITVVPHRVEFVPSRLPAPDHSAPLVIGIIGQISEQKGALVVKELVARIERDHPDVRVVVIGGIDIPVRSPRLHVTGAYKHEDLVGLIEANKINLAFFPSICPETFSYVTEEMIRLELPVVAFDLGAPGERLRGYRKGRLCPEVTAESALSTLLRYHEELAANEVSVVTNSALPIGSRLRG